MDGRMDLATSIVWDADDMAFVVLRGSEVIVDIILGFFAFDVIFRAPIVLFLGGMVAV
jgi:hypothetical protein